MFLLVFVPLRPIYLVLRDMVHVAGVLISHVGIFAVFLLSMLAWKYLQSVSILVLMPQYNPPFQSSDIS